MSKLEEHKKEDEKRFTRIETLLWIIFFANGLEFSGIKLEEVLYWLSILH